MIWRYPFGVLIIWAEALFYGSSATIFTTALAFGFFWTVIDWFNDNNPRPRM